MDVVEVDWCEEKKREQGRGKRGILISTVLNYSFHLGGVRLGHAEATPAQTQTLSEVK
jgi:hypothetical protein